MLQISLNTEADGSQKQHCTSERVSEFCEAGSFICKMVFIREAQGRSWKMHSSDLRTRLWRTFDHLLQTSLSHQRMQTLIPVTQHILRAAQTKNTHWGAGFRLQQGRAALLHHKSRGKKRNFTPITLPIILRKTTLLSLRGVAVRAKVRANSIIVSISLE